MKKYIIKADIRNSTSILLLFADNLGLLEFEDHKYEVKFEDEQEIKLFDIALLDRVNKNKFSDKKTKVITGNIFTECDEFEYIKNSKCVINEVNEFIASKSDNINFKVNELFNGMSEEIIKTDEINILFSINFNDKKLQNEFYTILNQVIRTLKLLYPDIVQDILEEMLIANDELIQNYINSEFSYCK